MIDADDPRIAKLPKWAQDMIGEGVEAQKRADYWHERSDQAEAEAAKLRADFARDNGAAEFDTWVVIDGGDDADGPVYGLGVGREVEFGGDPKYLCGDWTVTYRDGGLDIKGPGDGLVIKPGRPGTSDPNLRIE